MGDGGRPLMSRTGILTLAALTASGISVALLLVQVQEPHWFHYWYMAWNLTLAWIPLVLAVAFASAAAQRHGNTIRLVLFAAWLLFLPNAPYMVTDVVHLQNGPVPLVQYFMFTGFAVTGLVLGLGSLYVMHCALLGGWTRRSVTLIVCGCLVLCGVGLYLGRVVQVNSWDAVLAPGRVWRAVGDHVASGHGAVQAVLFVALASSALAAVYLLSLRVVGGATAKE
jgi:uncharacterized membrane protein